MEPQNDNNTVRWYVMRDLRRPNAHTFAYDILLEQGFEVFTPLVHRLSKTRIPENRPLIHGLLFVRDTYNNINPVVEAIPTLQFRFVPGHKHKPMVVPMIEMERFIHAVRATDSPRYYLPEEITPQMLGHTIRVIGGPLNGYEGALLSIRGSRVKRLLVRLHGFLSVGVEVSPEYIQMIK